MTAPFAWWNLTFLLPMGLGALFLGLQVVGLDLDLDGDLDLDADLDVDLDLDADVAFAGEVELDLDADLDADLDGDVEGEVEGDAAGRGPGLLARMAGILGVGRAPLMVVLTTFAFTWGFAGYALQTVLTGAMGSPVAAYPVAVLGAAVLSVAHTRAVAGLVGRWMPSVQTSAVSARDLEGFEGEARFAVGPGRRGAVLVRDPGGNLVQYAIRNVGSRVIPSGGAVQLLLFDAEADAFEAEVLEV